MGWDGCFQQSSGPGRLTGTEVVYRWGMFVFVYSLIFHCKSQLLLCLASVMYP